MRQVILDTETTGFDPKKGERIIEIGCVEMVNRQLTGNHYHVYINPNKTVDAGAIAVHGITNEFLEDKPVFEEIAQDFLDYVKGAQLVIHNAPFDVGFINHEFQWLRKPLGKIEQYCEILDTLTMARKKYPGQRNSLDALCKRFDIDNSHRELHGALLDSEILALVYLAMTSGQAGFELEIEKKVQSKAALANQHQQAAKKRTLPLIQLSEQEQLDHEAYLKSMQEKYGKCVWLEKET